MLNREKDYKISYKAQKRLRTLIGIGWAIRFFYLIFLIVGAWEISIAIQQRDILLGIDGVITCIASRGWDWWLINCSTWNTLRELYKHATKS